VTDDSSAVAASAKEPDDTARTGIDTTVPHSAGIWNYWLGGKDNYAVDRAAGD
jgi:S-adenosyl methyltransferase